ncbi:MAG: winged helix-turn-helix domain-containing protein [Bacteroidota bacterium]|nr:winged helix-turn-helix domain-containing protein [Flavisolibacter sp.]MDQ3843312.1 winged helix-turn-helix domain-containing protein [Bacteroidota bacterium]
MKPRVALKPHLSLEQIKERLYQSRNGRHASYWQIIVTVSLNPGKATKEYCAYLGISDTKFHRIVALYNEQGESFCDALQWGGRREKRCQISFEQEEELLQTQIATALEGGVLVAKQLREAAEKKVGHRVSDDYLWDMLHRHGWSKKAPRPEHPKAEQVKQKREAFKKKHPNSSSQKTQPNP